jgi:hypothetical protein
MSAKKRLERLEEDHAVPEGDPKAAEKRRQLVREQAEHANRCQGRDEPLFEITKAGDVFCARDGRPVTDTHQTLAEKFYWMEVGFGGEGLVHDAEAEAFYTTEGELALSRDFVHLERLLGDERTTQTDASEG